jgi:peptidoglycan/LPS O-acetylase OafA/YrhL
VVAGHTLHEAEALVAPDHLVSRLSALPWERGVDVFFIISGFVMMWTFHHRFGDQGASRDFLVKRLIRIVPLYWFFTTLLVLATLVVPAQLESAVFDWRHAACSYLFVPCFDREGEVNPILQPGWTLNYEMLFYSVFAFALLFSRRIGILAVFLMIAAPPLLLAYLGRGAGSAILTFLGNSIMLEFLMGMVFFLSLRKGELRPPALAGWFVVLGCGLTLQAAGALPDIRLLHHGLPAMAIVILGYVVLQPSPGAQPSANVLTMAGDASYTTYLSHPFLIELVFWASTTLLLAAGLPDGARLGFIPLAFAAVAAFSFVFYSWVERPVTRLLRRFLTAKRPFLRRLVLGETSP